MLRSALLLLSGNITGSVLGLARALIMARLLSVADFGIASTLLLAVSVIEMLSAFGIHQQMVQARDGDDPRFQATAQGFTVLRAVVNGLILFVLARPLADFLNVPEAAWGYQVMAVVPLLNALHHSDATRFNRAMVFGPSIVVGLVPSVVALLSVWPLAWAFGDWRAMLFVILIHGCVALVASHLVAERPYRLALDPQIVRRALRFGWPLLVNNILIFLVFNGDRLVVGRVLGMEALAIFAMGLSITLAPTLVLTKSVNSLFLPLLAPVDRSTPQGEQRFRHLGLVTYELNFLFGTGMALGVLLLGPPFVHLVLGEKYAALVPILSWLAVQQALRVFKGGPSLVALARGRTENAMIANLFRVALLPVAYLAAVRTGDTTTVIAIAIAGEFIGFGVALWLARMRTGLPLRPLLWPALTSLAVLGLVGLGDRIAGGGAWHAALAAAAFAASLATMADVRRYAFSRRRA